MNKYDYNNLPNGPLENWRDAEITQPTENEVVNAWTGRLVTKCKYMPERQSWTTEKGLPIKVLMWEKNPIADVGKPIED